MAKKIILISSGPLFIILAAIAIVFVGIGHGQPESIESVRTNIFSLIETNKWTEADSGVEKLISDYQNDARLNYCLSEIADSYCWRRKYDGAERMYQDIINRSSDAAFTAKARLGLARIDILKLIEQKKFSSAREQVDFMITDFKDEPNLPVALMQIGQEFTWKGQYYESKEAFDFLLNNFPDNPLFSQWKLFSARVQIYTLIWQHTLKPNAERAKDEDIIASIDKFISDFQEDPGLAEALLAISQHYEWAKGSFDNRNGWYDAPNSIYQQLIQKFGNTSEGKQAQWDQKRLTHRMKILNLMKEADQNQIDTAIENMVTEFKGRPEVPEELCWIAREYELYTDKREFAKKTYQKIIKEYPDSLEAQEARLDIPRIDIQSLIETGEINEANILIDKFVADCNEDAYAGSCLGRVAVQYYKFAFDLRKQTNYTQASRYFKNAEWVWQQIIDKMAVKAGDTDNAYFFAASCRQQRTDWDGALEYYQKIVEDWPDYKMVGGAQCAIGWCCEVLRDEGKIPKEQANAIIEESYQSVLTKYPDCYIAHHAAYQLAAMNYKKGNRDDAIFYYRKFLELAPPEHNWINKAKSQLVELEGAAK